jgi:hypothetical protein
MRHHLLLINVVVIILDIPILILEDTGLYDLQTAYKSFVYSVKLKMEFRILNQLVDMTRAQHDMDRRFHNSSSIQIYDGPTTDSEFSQAASKSKTAVRPSHDRQGF